ncbi:hypothetical protein QFC22_004468 [Naganishia vaughanmartiniae]|uniref:Uncharacterized protein n=1 Tax=Naganishia vaughanmartiniae TaxID=1424756 RepID=A0ACC2X1P7_9TREE|nr:hypothetical protein QFC22_004468 [Naganishia vaughanmartiniae]
MINKTNNMARPKKEIAPVSTAKAGVKRAASEDHAEQEEKRSKTSTQGITKRNVGRPRKSVVAAAGTTAEAETITTTTRTRRSVAGLPSSRRPRNSLAPNGILERTMRLSILPLAQAPEQHERPGKTLLVWGCGDSGEFGMGPDEEFKGEIGRPRLHSW